jgi:hypothetical protein
MLHHAYVVNIRGKLPYEERKAAGITKASDKTQQLDEKG